METLKGNCTDCDLLNCMINLYCDKDWRELIDKHKSTLQFPKGTRFITEGENVQGMYIVHNGKVKILKHLSENAEQIIRLAEIGDLVGHRGLGDKIYPISAVSLTDVTLAFIPNSIFIKILNTNHHLLFNMLNYFAKELRSSEEHQKKIVELSVKNKIAYALLMNAKAFGFKENAPKTLTFSLSRKEISNIATCTYETTIRMLKQLENEQIIKLLPKEIKILDINRIEQYSITN